MKRLCAILLCMALMLSGCGGTPQTEDGYVVYFRERDLESAAGGGALRAETTELRDGTGLTSEELAEDLLTALLAGPTDETLQSVVPQGTTLLSLELKGSRAVVDLSAAYGTLSGVALTLADQAVTLTLTQLPDILSVQITVRGRELDYRSRQVFTGREVLLAPEGDVVSTVQATLYFLDEDGELAPETRTLELYEGDTQVNAVAQALEDGPGDSGLLPVFPDDFQPRAVWMEEDVCYVNLSSVLLETLPEDTSLQMTLRSLARSLSSLEAVEETRFLVDGEFANFYGTVDLRELDIQS